MLASRTLYLMDSMESYSILELNILMSPLEAVGISLNTRRYTYYTNMQDTCGKFTLKKWFHEFLC